MFMNWASSWSLKRTLDVGGSLHNTHYRPDIDGIRAIAVLSVVLCHAAPDLVRGGFVGVDIFFVISGYLISNIIIQKISVRKFSILNFYNRRIRRIFPALMVVMLFLMLAGWFCLFRSEFSSLGQHIMASSLFSENVLLWSEAGYFDAASTTKPTLHLWSLAIEEQFYLLWPAILLISKKFRVNTGLVIIFLLIASFSINLKDIQSGSSSAYYSPFGRSWELMVGSLLSYIEKVYPKILSYQKTLQSVAGAVMITAAIILTGPDRAFPGVWAILPTVGTALLISAGANAFFNRNVLSAPPMVWCGLISYPLYLWHWPILSSAHICADPSSTLPRVTALACVAAAFLAAGLTFWFVEKPFRGAVETPGKTVFLVAAMVCVLGVGAWISSPLSAPRLSHFDAPDKTEWSFLKARTPSFDEDGVGLYSLGDPARASVLFIGDSRIAQYVARLDRIRLGDPAARDVTFAIGGGCIPIRGVTTPDRSRQKCWRLRDSAFEMAKSKQFSRIVIGGAWNWYFLHGDYSISAHGKSTPLTSSEGRTRALEALRADVRSLIASGKQVIILLDNPESQQFYLGRASIRLGFSLKNFAANQTIPADHQQILLGEDMETRLQPSGATLIHPMTAVCASNVCKVTDDTGKPIYKDTAHFNPDWAINNASFLDSTVLP